MGETTDKLAGYLPCLISDTIDLVGKTETSFHLFCKFMVESLDVDSRVVGNGVITDA